MVADESNIAMLMDMAFTREQAIKALKMTDNNMERAVDWIFNHPNDLGIEEEIAAVDDAPTANDEGSKGNLTDGQYMEILPYVYAFIIIESFFR